jgi:hypothetical protein
MSCDLPVSEKCLDKRDAEGSAGLALRRVDRDLREAAHATLGTWEARTPFDDQPSVGKKKSQVVIEDSSI